MTSLEKAINLGYLFLTFKPKTKKTSINAPLSSACIGMFQFIQKSIFDPNTCTLNWTPITGTVDVHWVNCPIWGWNNSLKKSWFWLSEASFSVIEIFFWLSTANINTCLRWFFQLAVEDIDSNHTIISRNGIEAQIDKLKCTNREYTFGQHIGDGS